jgi:hypothetical protein
MSAIAHEQEGDFWQDDFGNYSQQPALRAKLNSSQMIVIIGIV